MQINDTNIAIVHDWFLENSLGGAEKVTKIIDEFLIKNYSQPDIFTLATTIYKSEKNFLKGRKINTSFIQNLPFGKYNVQKYLPLLPYAIEQIDLSKYDLIISSSHAFAKGVITNPDQLHISYVHTPMRYAWDLMNTYVKKPKFPNLLITLSIRYILYKLREWDYYSSQRIDFLIANSSFTAKRIKKYWGLDSKVIHPPVDIEKFKYQKKREDFYLSVNRLVPNKRIDLLIDSFNKLGLPLIIIGDGPEESNLKKLAKSNIKFLNKASNKEVVEYMSRCRAFVYAGLEDFGIAPVEAMASGAPVIAYGKGGILDTVKCLLSNEEELSTGLLFKEQTSLDIYNAIYWFDENNIWKKFNPESLNNYSQRFNSEIFKNKFESFINNSWEKFKKNS